MTNEREHKRNRLSARKVTENMAKRDSFLSALFVVISVLSTEVKSMSYLSLYSWCSTSHMQQVVGTQ